MGERKEERGQRGERREKRRERNEKREERREDRGERGEMRFSPELRDRMHEIKICVKKGYATRTRFRARLLPRAVKFSPSIRSLSTDLC